MKDAYFRANAAAVIINESGNLLIGKRKSVQPETWKFVQGGIHVDETPQQAILREIGEEAGIPVNKAVVLAEMLDWIVYETPTRWAKRSDRIGQAQKWFLIRIPDSIVPQPDNNEFDTLIWVEPENLMSHINNQRSETYLKVLPVLLPNLRF